MYLLFVCIYVCITDETILLDLKHILMEAKQIVPDFLRILESENQKFEDHGCKCTTSQISVSVILIIV